MPSEPLRVVTFSHLPIAYEMLTNWIHDTGNQHVLAVTTPGPTSRPTPSYRSIVDNTPRDVDILITTRLKSVATPLIRALKPDLIACFSFPYRITPELCNIPRYGAVNLHAAILPAYRGPNVMRQFYEGWPVFGATAHWIAEDYDTGNILSQKSAPLPNEITRSNILPMWLLLIAEAIAEGMECAVAGDIGTVQDHSNASYAAPFTAEEMWLNLHESQQEIQRKEMALNMMDPGQAKIKIEDEVFSVINLDVLPPNNKSISPGKCIERDAHSMVVQVADGSVRMQVQPLLK